MAVLSKLLNQFCLSLEYRKIAWKEVAWYELSSNRLFALRKWKINRFKIYDRCVHFLVATTPKTSADCVPKSGSIYIEFHYIWNEPQKAPFRISPSWAGKGMQWAGWISISSAPENARHGRTPLATKTGPTHQHRRRRRPGRLYSVRYSRLVRRIDPLLSLRGTSATRMAWLDIANRVHHHHLSKAYLTCTAYRCGLQAMPPYS
jgi:hypothetical protein